MKLRWVEREENGFMSNLVIGTCKVTQKVKVLQYCNEVDEFGAYGDWVDVPLEVEE
jgi:hypothetical protein